MHTHPVPALVLLALASTALPAQSPGFWEVRPSLTTPRQEVGAATLQGKVYVAGGLDVNRASIATVERYDPVTQKWSFVAPLPTTLHHLGMAANATNAYVFGGYVSGFTGTNRCYRYDPGADRWNAIADLPRARGALAAVELGGKFYAVGGVVPRVGTVGDLTVYDPANNQWQTLASMPTFREHTAAAALGGKIYVAGGRRGGNFNILESYDPATNQWTRLKDMPTARGGNGAGVLGGRLIVVGGENPGVFPQTEEYDPATNTWRSLELMNPAVHGIYPVTIGGELMVAGGATVAGFGAVNVVRSLRMLPDGVEAYGRGTPSCRGDVLAYVTHRPRPGEGRFTVVAQAAPPSSTGFLALGSQPDVIGSTVLGFRTHLDLLQFIVLVPITTDAQGESSVRLPLPANAGGNEGYLQFAVLNTAACGGQGTVSSSHGLHVVVK